MPDVLEVVIYTVVSFIILFMLAKLLGKKQLAQLDFVDYIVGISIGSIAANMATDLSAPYYHYIIAMVGFFLLDIFISFIGKKGPFFKKMMQSRAVTIIYEGKISYANLKKSRLNMNEFLSICRAKNYFDINDIYYAVLETSGDISIIPTARQRPVVAEDIGAADEQTAFPNYLVCDGIISYSGLNEICKDENWLLSKLDIKDKKELKNIILAVFDSESGNVNAHYKEENS